MQSKLSVLEARAEGRTRRRAESARCVAAAVAVKTSADAALLIDRAIGLAAAALRDRDLPQAEADRPGKDAREA